MASTFQFCVKRKEKRRIAHKILSPVGGGILVRRPNSVRGRLKGEGRGGVAPRNQKKKGRLSCLCDGKRVKGLKGKENPTISGSIGKEGEKTRLSTRKTLKREASCFVQ